MAPRIAGDWYRRRPGDTTTDGPVLFEDGPSQQLLRRNRPTHNVHQPQTCLTVESSCNAPMR